MADQDTQQQSQDGAQDTDTQQQATDAARGGADGQQGDAPPDPTQDFEAWLEAQGEPAKTGYEKTTSGLKSALDKERDRAATTERELRDALAELKDVEGAQETVKELEAKLDDAQTQREAAERELDFVIEATREGVSDPTLAWKAVQGNDDLVNRSGRVDFGALKDLHPALFAAKNPPPPDGTPGAGTGSAPTNAPSMDDIIRGRR